MTEPEHRNGFGERIFNEYLRRGYTRASLKASTFIDNIRTTENLIMLVLAIIVGLLAGFGAVGIRAMIREISGFFYPGSGTLLDNIAAAAWYYKLLIPALGGLIIGPIIYYLAPEAKGTGVPEVMQSVLMKSGHIRPRVAFIKAIVSTITIGTGGSVGREGPIVQIGSSLGSTVGQFFQISSKRLKTLVGCGAAAGIAAAFNAPVAGALFAVEIILMDYAIAQFSPIVISSVMATVVSHAFEGDFPAIEVAGQHALRSPYEVGFYMLLGVLAGVVSYLFIKGVYSAQDFWEKKIRVNAIMKAALGGAAIGVIALFFPQIMGVGYDSINLALNFESMTYMGIGSDFVNGLLGDQVFWVMVLMLVFVKIWATSITLGSGGSGGIFAPSLFIGAMLGGFFGHFTHLLLPDISASVGTYALIGMGGLVAGTTRAPITAILTIFELTKEVSIILPLMIVCIISTIISSKFTTESIYTLKLLLRNINIKSRNEVNVMKTILVKDIFRREYSSVPSDCDFQKLVTTIVSEGLPYLSVHSQSDDAFIGMISIDVIKEMIFERDSLRLIAVASDLADKSIKHVHLDDNCSEALKKMRRSGFEWLPVLDNETHRRQIGIIRLQDIVDAHEDEVEKIDITSDLAAKISMQNIQHDIRFLEGYVITEVPAPNSFVGRTIKELEVRGKYGVDILSVKNESRYGRNIEAIPQADYTIHENDYLIIAGRAEKINLFKNLD